MKAIVCGACGDIRGIRREMVTCDCGNIQAVWEDPDAGTVLLRTRDRRTAFILGLNNRLLVPGLRGELAMWEDFREAHEAATDAPGYVFDKARAGCWAALVRAGFSNVVTVENMP